MIRSYELLYDIIEPMQIKSVHGDGSVVFEDGSVVVADTILHCTGYVYIHTHTHTLAL